MAGAADSVVMTGPSDGTDDRARAAARRAFIRAQHPDAGGDPDRFMAGLARFDDTQPAPSSNAARPSVHRSRRPDRVVTLAVRRLRRRIAGRPPRNLQ